METPLLASPGRDLFVVGGNLALDFANTVDDPYGPLHFDHVGDVAGLVGWSRQRGLLTSAERDALVRLGEERPVDAAAELQRAHDLRTSIQSVFTAVAGGQPPTRSTWAWLRDSAAEALGSADLQLTQGQAQPVWVQGDTWASLTRPIAYEAFRLLTGDQLARVKRCAACPWLYLDQSKNASRRWCTMEDCGKNEKMRRYVERRAARRRAPG